MFWKGVHIPLTILKKCQHLTVKENRFIQCRFNSVHLFAELKVDSISKFKDIRIRDTKFIRANFVQANLSSSEFNNMDISSMNLNEEQCKNTRAKQVGWSYSQYISQIK